MLSKCCPFCIAAEICRLCLLAKRVKLVPCSVQALELNVISLLRPVTVLNPAAVTFTRPVVTFPTTEHHHPLAGTKLYCLVTEALE